MKKILAIALSCLFVFSLPVRGLSSNNGEAEKSKKISSYVAKVFDVKEFDKEFSKVKENKDELGFTHVKLNQKVNGIPVYGGDIIMHFNSQGDISSVSGEYVKKAKEAKLDKIIRNKNEIIEVGKEFVIANFAAEDPEITADLYWYEFKETFIPTYVLDISYLYPEAGRWKVFVNAYDGTILEKYNNLKTNSVVGTGTGYIKDTKNINLDLVNGIYYLRDLTKTKGMIYTNDAKSRTSTKSVAIMTDTDNIWNSSYQASAIDAHFYVGVTYDYYKEKFNRISYDNVGKDIKVIAHYGKNYNNAFWDGKELVFGDGDGTEFGPFSADLDIVAHEYTHAVGENEGNLVYSGQSGALEEATADIMCIFALDYYKTKYFGVAGTWLFCENAYTPKIVGDQYYSYVDPAAYNYPDNMSKYLNTTGDNGGVHTNCTIIGHAAYTIASSIGNAKAEQIVYRAMCNYYTSQTNFAQARVAWVNAAKDLYGVDSAEYKAVIAGFDHVGIQ